MKKLSESIWGDIRKKSLGKEEREENEIGNIKYMSPVDVDGDVLWANKDFELADGTCFFDYEFAKNFGEVKGWRLPTLEEADDFLKMGNLRELCNSDESYFIHHKTHDEYLWFKKRGFLNHNDYNVRENEYAAWIGGSKYAEAFGFEPSEPHSYRRAQYRVLVNRSDCKFCIRLVRDRK